MIVSDILKMHCNYELEPEKNCDSGESGESSPVSLDQLTRQRMGNGESCGGSNHGNASGAGFTFEKHKRLVNFLSMIKS